MKLPTLHLNFQTKEYVPRVNKSEITGENVFNGDYFEIEDNHKSSKEKKFWFQIYFQIFYPLFNPYTAKYLYPGFLSIVWFFANFKSLPVDLGSYE